MIYLDNGATTYPKPLSVRRAVWAALEQYGANSGRGGHAMAQKTAEAIFAVRTAAATMFEARPSQVMFPLNCTAALNFVLKGTLRAGDHVVTTVLEHNAVMRPLEALRAKGVTYSCVAWDYNRPETCVEQIKRACRRNTRMVLVTAGSNVFGIRTPISEIGAFCRERRLLFAVDAAQGAGVIPLSMEADGIDYLCAAPHKGLYAPMGTGLLIARAPLRPLIEGGTGVNSAESVQPEEFPERMESGTLNTCGILGMGAGLEFVRSKGVDAIYHHELRLVQRLYDRLADCSSVRLYTSRPQRETSLPLLSFNVGNIHSEETATVLDREGFALRAGLHCAPAAHRAFHTLEQGTVRVCPSVFTTEGQIDLLAEKIEKFAKNS